MKKIILSSLFFSICCTCAAQDSLAFSIGSNSFSKGNAQDAIYWFSKSIEKNYLPADSYMYRGASSAYIGAYDEALRDLFYSYKLDSTISLTCEFIGNVYLAQNKLDSSIIWLTKAIKIDPKDADAYNNKAVAYKAQKDFDKAMAAVESAISCCPKNRSYILNRAAIKQEQLNYEGALEDYNMTLAIDPMLEKNIMTYVNMAICHASLNSMDEALADVDKILTRYPNTGEALEARGQLYQAMGRKDEACSDFEKLNAIDSTVGKDCLDKYCR